MDPSSLGANVEAKLAVKRDKTSGKPAEPELPPPLEVADERSVVVTGTSPKITKALFTSYFAQFGELESVQLTRKQQESRA